MGDRRTGEPPDGGGDGSDRPAEPADKADHADHAGNADAADPAAAGGYALPDPEWPVLEAVVEYETPWYTGGYDLVEQPDGSRKRYYWAALRPAVVVTAVADGTVLFVEQYRPTIRGTQLELPAGIVEPGESPADAAARELAEETGFAPDGTAIVQEVWVATGVLRHRRYYAFCEGLTPVERALDGNEFLAVEAVPADEAVTRAREAPTNEATIQGLLLARADGLL